MDIDWSKAPEGATHFSDGNSRNSTYPAWWRPSHKHEGKYECWAVGTSFGCELWQLGPFDLPDRAVKREWTGEGLPPVGTTCRVRVGYANELPEFDRCEVIAHFDGENDRCAAYVRTHHDGVRLVGQGVASAFRPILTPEQIAAEERLKAIEEMWKVYWQPGVPTAKAALGLLWDAGYRKLVAP